MEHVDKLTSQLNVLQIAVNGRIEEIFVKLNTLQERIARLEVRQPAATPADPTVATGTGTSSTTASLEPTIPFQISVISGSQRERHPNESHLTLLLQASGRDCYTLLIYYNNTRGPRDNPARVIYDLDTGELRSYNAQAALTLTQYRSPAAGYYNFLTYAEFILRALRIDPVITAIWNVTHNASS